MTTPADYAAVSLPKTQVRLLHLLLSEPVHVTIPPSLYGAARELHGHADGHMVTLNHTGNAGQFLRVRLTGRGRDLAASMGIVAVVPPTPEDHRREKLERESALYISQWGRLPGSGL